MKKFFAEPEPLTVHAPPLVSETAVFIMPDRVSEILREKPNASIDDILE